jgi:eukaryotic-like serine/threonine-protein kinase
MAVHDNGGGAASPNMGNERMRDPLLGSVINGKFHIKKAIARGGMGRIYLATQVPVDRPVALKVVQADSVNEEESQFLKRFLQEASILAKLQHPNVVTLFDYGRIEDAPVEMYFIAMEYLAGETLAQRLKSRPVLSTPEVLVLFRQIARGLREAHARGVVHRDLKPSNIILVPEADGEIVKLVDFGIGKMMSHEGADDLTQDGVMVGTPKYMAPEQFEGSASTASDIYSLGTIAYQALTGALPFHGGTLGEFMVAKFAHPIPRMRELNPATDATESLEMLVFRMLARRPEERPSLDEVFAMLMQCEDEIFGTSGARHQMMMTGSGPISRQALPSSPRAGSSADLKVPFTLVAPVPSMGTFTPRPMATSTRPAPTPASTGRGVVTAIALSVAFALLTLGGIGAWWAKSRANAAKQAAPAPVESAPLPPASTTDVPTTFTLTIDSAPAGAAVMEGDKQIGTTPMQIMIDRAAAMQKPRTLVVKKDGFVAATVVQGPTMESSVKTVVSLAPEPTQPVKSHAAAKGGGGSSGKPSAPSGSQSPSDLDIRLKR